MFCLLSFCGHLFWVLATYSVVENSFQITKPDMPPKQVQDEDYVAPKDKADAQARQYEESHDHERAGHEKSAPSHQAKPKSVHH